MVDEQDTSGSLSPRALWTIAGSVVAGVCLYLAGVVFTDFEEIRNSSADVSLVLWIVLLLTSLVNYVLRFWRWHIMLNYLERTIPSLQHLLYYISGFALSTTPGKVGEAIRSVYLRRYGVKVEESISALFVERFMDLISVTFLALFGMGILADSRIAIIASVVVLLALILGIVSPIPAWIERTWIDGHPQNIIRRIIAKLLYLVRISHTLLISRLFVSGNVIGLIAWFAEGLGFYLLCDALGFEISLFVAVGIYGFSILIGALSFLPGGLGTTEAVMGAMLVGLGVSPAKAVLATVICSLVTLWFAVLLGLLSMLVITKQRAQKV